MDNFTIIMPIYNEESLTLETINMLEEYLYDLTKRRKLFFEVVFVDNASTDNTYEVTSNYLAKKQSSFFKVTRTSKRGLGLAIKEGIKTARHGFTLIYAVDLPFGLEIIEKSAQLVDDSTFIIGSKAHPESKIKRSWKRTFLSKLLFLFNLFFFKLTVRDPTGSLCFDNRNIKDKIDIIKSEGPFFSIELIMYFQGVDFKFLELPIIFKETRPSKIKVIKDGTVLLKEMIIFAKDYLFNSKN